MQVSQKKAKTNFSYVKQEIPQMLEYSNQSVFHDIIGPGILTETSGGLHVHKAG